MRERSAWLLSLPLTLGGCLAAHILAYRLVEPDAHERALLLAASGHGYLAHLPFAGLAAATLVLAGALRRISLAASGRTTPAPSPLLFAALPPLAFLVQEHLERAVQGPGLPLDTLLEPTSLVGLALQAPLALLAYAAARLIFRAADSLGEALRQATRTWPATFVPALAVFSPSLRPSLLALGHAQRGPPPLR